MSQPHCVATENLAHHSIQKEIADQAILQQAKHTFCDKSHASNKINKQKQSNTK